MYMLFCTVNCSTHTSTSYKRKRSKKKRKQRYIFKNSLKTVKVMILKEFKTGWQITFEERIQFLFTLWPDIKLISINRNHGMLRIKLEVLDKQVQYVLDSVSYKIERESVHTCEMCGNRGVRREEFLSEKMCLCWKCYALEVDAIESNNK